jgi:release factor glutamine methyltransferase
MINSDWLIQAQKQLEKAGISTARLDALVLLEDALHTNRAQLLAHPEVELTVEQEKTLKLRISRRARHEPLAYIRNKSEFYGREFQVSPYTLVPRPETETMIDLLKSLTLFEDAKLADVGTGSGCIAITAMLELQTVASIDAYEIDKKALQLAKENAQTLGASNVKFHLNNLLSKVTTRYDVVLANLPYVPENFQINLAATHEPRHAIFGGPDGLDLYRQLFEQLSKQPPNFVLTEALPPQHPELASIAKAAGFQLQKTEDFIQLFVPKQS